MKLAAESENSCSSSSCHTETLQLNLSSDNESDSIDLGKSSSDDENSQSTRGRGRGRGRSRGRGRGRSRSGGDGPVKPPKPVWSQTIIQPVVHEWQGNNAAIGPHVRSTIEMTPIDWFFIFFTPHMMTNIVLHTNQNAIHCGNDRWTKLTVREFEIWLGLTIAMGIHKLPSLKYYWSNEWLFAIPQFKSIMTRFRYQDIKSHLYFSNPGETHTDPIGKIRLLLNEFCTQCREKFHPPRQMSIDEMMVKTKSKFSQCKIRNPQKPIRDGIKIEALCDSKTGYLYTFHVHTPLNLDLVNVGSSKTMNLITTLVTQLPFKGFQIYMDNYYSSIPTFRHLHNIGHMNAIGTTRLNRISADLTMKKSVPRGTMNWRITTKMDNETVDHAPILSYAWKDSGVVYLLSTSHRGGDTITVTRQSGASFLNVLAPSMVEDYCMGMRGVDIANQLRSTYCIRQKNKRWYLSLFYWMVESAIINAFVCSRYHDFNENFPYTKSHLTFRSTIIYNLIGYALNVNIDRVVSAEPPIRTRLNTIDSLPTVRVINALHLPVRKTKGRCQWCWLMKVEQHRTNYKCRECHVNLCIECFVPFHDFRP